MDIMFTRSRESTIHFNQPFRLSQLDEAQPGGTYRLITEEERLESPKSFETFRRVRTLLYLTADALPGRTRPLIDVDPPSLPLHLLSMRFKA
jgi:hypothetical protein